MTTMVYTDADYAAAREALRQYLLSPEHTLDSYGELLTSAHEDISTALREERMSFIDFSRQSHLINIHSIVLQRRRSDTEPVNSWATTEETASGPLCVHCSIGRGRDRKVVRHASAEQLRRCDDIMRIQRAESLAEQHAERQLERAYEERGSMEPDEPAHYAW